jgi:hypothetical protein
MSAGLHPTIMRDLTSSMLADRRGTKRDREQRAASRQGRPARGRVAHTS